MSSLQVNFEILLLLLKASSKQQVVDICQDAFKYREKEIVPNFILKKYSETFNIEFSEVSKLITALSSIIKFVLFHGYSTIEGVSSLFPDDFHKNLRDLLSKIISEKYIQWKAFSVSDSAYFLDHTLKSIKHSREFHTHKTFNILVSMPRLTDFDWRVDLKMASGKIARMSEPTCILHLKIHDPGVSEDHEDRFQTLNVELSKEKLDTMLHGLGRIRDQLTAVAKK